MAHHKSAIKRIRQNEKIRLRNRRIRSTLRSAIKRLEQSIQEQNVDAVKSLFQKTISITDKAASKGVIHKNNAARQVSRLTKKVSALLESSP